MLNSVLYRRGAIKKRVPYSLVLKFYWKSLIGTCGAWFLYGILSPLFLFRKSDLKAKFGKISSPFPTASSQGQ
jgi:hypothetical protein